MPRFKLEIKVGCPIMVLRNLAPSEGLCNGTRLLVTRCGQHVIEAKILTGDKAGEIVFIPRINFKPTATEMNINLTRRQQCSTPRPSQPSYSRVTRVLVFGRYDPQKLGLAGYSLYTRQVIRDSDRVTRQTSILLLRIFFTIYIYKNLNTLKEDLIIGKNTYDGR